jgi:hypothetical protein
VLLLGAPSVIRIDAPINDQAIALDDWRRSVNEFPPAAARELDKQGELLAERFLRQPSLPYVPVLPPA